MVANVHNSVSFRSKYQVLNEWSNTFSANEQTWDVLDPGEKIGADNPNYKQQIALRQDASTNYSVGGLTSWSLPTIRTRTIEDYGFPYYAHSGVCILTDGCRLPLLVDDAGQKDLALKRIKRKLASSQNEFKALIPLGELKELRGLVRSTAESTFKVVLELSQIKKGKGTVKGLLHAMGDSWLNYSFAIAPTVSDTIQLASTISDYLLRQDHSYVEHAGSQSTWMSTDFTGGRYVNAGLQYDIQRRMYHKLTYRYLCGVNFNVSAGNNYSAFDAFGATERDIASAIYELTPYSWLLDYFTTTGDWLEDAFTSPGMSTNYVVLNTHYDYHCDLTYRKIQPVAYWSKGLEAPEYAGYVNGYRFRREKLTSLPHRAFRVKSVDEIGKSAVNKLLNLTSLLAVQKLPSGAHAHRWSSNVISR
jgi:hypothetical protein